jgi:hypothetical protein
MIRTCRNCFFYLTELNSFRVFCGNKEKLEKDSIGFFKLKVLSREEKEKGCKLWKKRQGWLCVHDFNFITGELK